ncbi:MAG: NADH:flavin oxidoreductase [Pirellulales bacterium]|nr:NADH:flavin oxidoreductase [Pirellulales bacterium]
MKPRPIAHIKSPQELRRRLRTLGYDIPVDEEVLSAAAGSPLAQPLTFAGLTAGNRWCIHPMEGWDALPDGSPSTLTLRRWENFGRSGAKLIWGGEAAAVREDGRANPHQTLAVPANRAGLARLLDTLRQAHQERFGNCDDLVIGLQLTHSGRFARPQGPPAPRIACHHPLLDRRFGIDPEDDAVVWSDAELQELTQQFVAAAALAHEVGFHFVDIKACHGYLLHEFLGAWNRPGPYGGDLEGRSRLLCQIISGVRAACPGLAVCVRLSAFDTVPYEPHDGQGRPMRHDHLLPYRYAFGVDPQDPCRFALDEPILLLRRLATLGVAAVNISAGSPYYCPHVQRPAWFPPSDGYPPPEDPLVGVARQIEVARRLKQAVPALVYVGTGYSYLQDYLPHVAQAVVRAGWIDAVGLGRMALAYPELPAHVLQRGELDRKRLCRTFSDCTTAPRNGLPSGCFPLDPYYKALPEAGLLRAIKSRKSEAS